MTRCLLAITIAGLSLGCQQSPTVPKSASQPVVLTMAFSTKTFRRGKPDTISVTATSTLATEATIFFDNGCQILVTIRSDAGAAVVPPNGTPSCSPAVSKMVLPPKGTVVQKFVWSGTDRFLPSGSSVTLPAGTYYVSAAINGTNYSTFAPAVKVDLITQ